MDVIYFSLGTEWATEDPPLAPCAHCAPSPLERVETALWQHLAPFRLEEYAYVGNDLLPVERALFGFPGGLMCDADDAVPAAWVSALAAQALAAPPPLPIFLYLKIAEPVAREQTRAYGLMLSAHLDRVLTGFVPAPDGAWCRWRFVPDGGAIDEGPASPRDRDRLLPWAALRAGIEGEDAPDAEGRWARFRFGFEDRQLEFSDQTRRDAFLSWTVAATDALFRSPALSLPDLVQPANAADVRLPGRSKVRLPAPPDWVEGDPWDFSGGKDGKVGAEAYWAHVRGLLVRSCGARLPWSPALRGAVSRRRGEVPPR